MSDKAPRSSYPITEADRSRFWDRVVITPTCWLWSGYLNKDGYGEVWTGGGTRLAHRIAYQLEYGSIPDGMTIDHVAARGCMNKHCVLASHLEPVTNLENCERADVWRFNRNKTHCPSGHAYTEDNVRRFKGSRSCVSCNRIATKRYRERRRAA